MKVCLNVKDFYEHNSKEMEKVATWFTGLREGQDYEDILQDFYLDMCKRRALEQFVVIADEAACKSLYQAYVFSCFGNFLSSRKRAAKIRVGPHNSISNIEFRRSSTNSSHSAEAYEHLGNLGFGCSSTSASPIRLNLDGPRVDSYRQSESEDVYRLVSEFKEYLGTLNERPNKLRRMFKYIDWAENDLCATSLAESEGVSSTYIKDIKKALQAHAERFLSDA